MTSPYRRPGARPPEEAPREEPARRPSRDIGRRVSSHARLDLAAKASAALGEEAGVDLHVNGLVRRGLLGRRDQVLFTDIDEVRYRFDGDPREPPHISLVTFEGQRIEIPPMAQGERLSIELYREVSLPLVEPAREALARAARLVFGALVLRLDGIEVYDTGVRALPWSGLPRVLVGRSGFAFHRPDTHGRFAFLPLGGVPHPSVLVELLRDRTRVVLQDIDALRMIGIAPERDPSEARP